MKTFSVNKNSWHYKLNLQMVKTNDHIHHGNHAETYVMSKDNLCSYWQMTLWSMFKVLVVLVFFGVLIAGILAALFLIGNAFILHTQQALITTGVILSLFAAIFGISAIITMITSRKKEKLNKILYDGETETSLAKAQYSSWKNGICLPVEFKE